MEKYLQSSISRISKYKQYPKEKINKKEKKVPHLLRYILLQSILKRNGQLNREEIKEKRKSRSGTSRRGYIWMAALGTNDFSLFGKTEITTVRRGRTVGEDEDTKIPLRGNRR